ncbi:MAG: RecX family transcriptional regulator [Fidelibacterota bacterium]
MPEILRITQQKKHPDRYNLFLDNDERISITADMIIKYRLSPGILLNDKELRELKKTADIVFTREKAIELLSLRDHGSGELKVKLLQKGYDKDIIAKVIRDLLARDYLNDRRFAEMFANELIRVKHLGPYKVKEKLFQRGVRADIISQLLADYDNTEQVQNCRYHFEKKHKRLIEEDPEKRKQKIIRFLQGKGFGWNSISKII